VISRFHRSAISSARRLADCHACLLDHLGVLSAFGEQIERLNARQYVLERREQIGRGSYEPSIRLRGPLIEAADLDVLGRAVDLGNQQVTALDAATVAGVIDSPRAWRVGSGHDRTPRQILMPRRFITWWKFCDSGGAGRAHDLTDGLGAKERGCHLYSRGYDRPPLMGSVTRLNFRLASMWNRYLVPPARLAILLELNYGPLRVADRRPGGRLCIALGLSLGQPHQQQREMAAWW
jgi:hypothetical protein